MAFLLSFARRLFAPHDAPVRTHRASFDEPARQSSPTSASWILHSR
jgi:hypothetical protein